MSITEDRCKEISEAVLAWVRDLIPELADGQDFISADVPELPFAIVEVTDVTTDQIGVDDRFPTNSIQQAWTVGFTVDILIACDNTNPETADAWLKRSAMRLVGSMFQDGTLGQRVPFTSRQTRTDFTLPFVRWDNGDRARQAVLTIAVADLET